MGLDEALSFFAVGQLIFATLQSGSLFIKSRIALSSRLQGPLILSTTDDNETTLLWDVTSAFRNGVELGLLRENYTSPNQVVVSKSVILNSPGRAAKADDTYHLSLRSAEKRRIARNRTSTDESGMTFCENEDEKASDTTIILNYGVSLSAPPEIAGRRLSADHLTVRSHRSSSKIFVRAYAVNLFTRLRSMFGISEKAFYRSLLESGPYVSFQTNSKGAARTGAIFFFTRDGAYLVKTIKEDEAATLLQMLPKYCTFMEENGRRSLLSRFCGIYEVCFGDECRTLVIMNSVFPARASDRIAERFDLKGSTVGRECPEKERIANGRNAVLKDVNFARENLGRGASDECRKSFCLGPPGKGALLEQLQRDTSLLKDCNVIDYSLFVGVELVDYLNFPKGKKMGLPRVMESVLGSISGSRVVDGGEYAVMRGERQGFPACYYFGLIDFLQPFNVKKEVEWRLKSVLYKKDTFSCVPPDVYAMRLIAFLDHNIS